LKKIIAKITGRKETVTYDHPGIGFFEFSDKKIEVVSKVLSA